MQSLGLCFLNSLFCSRGDKWESDYQANFRFAHAETVIPFVSLMGIEKTDVQVCRPDSVSVYWKDYEISPMAANVQWLFYRDRDQRIWVKILLNEEAAALPISTACFHITLGKKLVYSLISESKWLKKHFQFSMNRISHFLVLIIFEKNIFSIYQ